MEKINDPKELHEKHKELKKELWSRGFYVNEVGHHDEIHYLVVSCMTPKLVVERSTSKD